MRIYKRGNIYWCEFQADKKVYRYSCKTKDKALAQEVAAALNADIVRSRFAIPAKYKAEKSFTVIWEEYIKSLPNTKETIRNKIIAYHHFTFTNKDIKSITKQDIEYYQIKRKSEVLEAKKTRQIREQDINFRWINLEIATLRHFFHFCYDRGYIDKNPATGIKKLNELSRLKTLSDSDIQKLIAGATNKLTRDLITFLIYTGCRKGEALNLKWDDVDLQNNVIAIKGTKTKYDRYIPIHTQLKEL
ncbi:MAG: tyrosine-type recombinase/integrase, partial [bacterium]